jgi:colanic acid biosynthesis glycosyl transferase WcaI
VAKILIHSIVFKPDGVSTAYLYADLVSELKKAGHEITVLTSTPHYNKVPEDIVVQPLIKKKGGLFFVSKYDGVDVYHIPMIKSKSTILRIFGFMKFHFMAIFLGVSLGRFDIVLAPSPPLTIGVIAYIIAKFRGAKAIYNVQEIYPDFAINQGIVKNGFIISILKYIEKFVYTRSAAVVTIDEKFSDIIEGRFDSHQKLFIIPNFVDTKLYAPANRINEFSTRHALNEKFVVAYAGNIGFAQNWEPIIYAAQKLNHLPVHFLIVGDGVRKPWLEEEIKRLQLQNILLLNYQQRELMPLINASADIHTIVMSADMDSDGFPSKIYTIMSSGKPAIVSTGSNSPLRNLLQKAMYKRIVPLNSNEEYATAIVKAYEEKELLMEEGLCGRRFIEDNYSKEAIGLKYNQLINLLSANKA